MAEPSVSDSTIFIDVGKGAEPYSIPLDFGHTNATIRKNEELKSEFIKLEIEGNGVVAKSETTNKNEIDTKNPCLVIQQRRIKCPECSRYTAENEEKMLRHIKKRHRGENPFTCYMCDYSTYNKTLFEEHVRIHQGIKPFKCSHCDHRTVSKKNLKKHEQIHRPDNPLRCDVCSFIAQNPSSLRSHKKKGCNEQTFRGTCDFCEFSSDDITEMRKHEKAHRQYKCKRCDFKTKLSKVFKNHKLTCKKIVKRTCKFACQICGWSSKLDTKILLHLIHHPDQKVDESVIDVSVLRKCGIMS